MQYLLPSGALVFLLALTPVPNQTPEGFTSLFNGTDLTGWQDFVAAKGGLRPQDEGHWTVKKGVIEYDGKGVGLATEKEYVNFELLMDWKINKGGRGVIRLRGMPAVRLCDPNADYEGHVWGSGGLIHGISNQGFKPLVKADKPVGEWNTFRIIVKGNKVTVYLNSILAVDDKLFVSLETSSGTLPAKGVIGMYSGRTPLQNQLWFKNIYIRELPE
jgi:hypothetical protein